MNIEYPIRLNSFLAKSGCGSRRSCESLIQSGRVKVNMARVTDLATKVGAEDVVMVDDVPVEPVERAFYYALNKPRGYLCTNWDPNEKLLRPRPHRHSGARPALSCRPPRPGQRGLDHLHQRWRCGAEDHPSVH